MFKNNFKKQNGGGAAKQNGSKAKVWGQVKFVPKVPNRPREENFANAATPWRTFKDQLLEKQREEDTSNTIDMNSPEAKEIIKKREQSYRRMLIIEQAKQQTTWESFEDDKDKSKESQNSKNAHTKIKNEQKASKKFQHKKNATKQKKIFHNRLLAGVDLENFDSKQLTFDQNNTFRKILTKGISGTRAELHDHVKSWKFRKSLQEKHKKKP